MKQGRMAGCNGCNRRKARRHLEVYETPVQLADRRAVFPPNAEIQGEAGAQSPIVCDVSSRPRRAEILVRVAEGDRAGVGDAEQEPGEIGSSRSARESKSAPRILLRKQIELLPAEEASQGEIV